MKSGVQEHLAFFAAILIIAWLLLCFFSSSSMASDISENVRERIRQRMEYTGGNAVTAAAETIYSSVALPRFYEQRGYSPAWLQSGAPSSNCQALVRAIGTAGDHGLNPSEYHLDKIVDLLNEVAANQKAKKALNPGRLADLEFLLSDSFLIYGAHLLGGKVNPETIEPDWTAGKREADLPALLAEALKTNDVEKALKSLAPQDVAYRSMQDLLKQLRAAAPQPSVRLVQTAPSFKLGYRGPQTAALRARLAAAGFLGQDSEQDKEVFNESLEAALKKFQASWGLEADGVCGPATLHAVNRSEKDNIAAIRANLERWRWMPQNLGDRHILVNIADFHLAVVENGEELLAMKAIVGKLYRKTPVFSGRLTYLVISPYWDVPPSIARKDKLPLMQKDPNYFTANHFLVYQGWGADSREIDPASVDWKALGPNNFPYRLRQKPGPGNALGRIKFMFPNKHNVYIHDTPSHDLFAKSQRNFSSGCIRIQDPIGLAEYLLKDAPGWNREAIEDAVDNKIEKTVSLSRPIPVHIMYFTAFGDTRGAVHFRNDIYGRDARLLEALDSLARN
ncbi:ErfK/YbiS/YcfS/YnhG family protein [Desulfatibacillum aliphaticivorans]|uniref:ErfK/YbiS/YcfS/YnhG family protein n=1 Tax=Desulfatibacillum aliphaticivorans TaxID=218208 RepID=B8FBW2_DESAL|nr:L,D-transpeptidase family protein [Desulfatibacillum aliphaticivorans]ACL05167.1 ErfK/YbiS/YcfS/YnhG family protein [Desulfatibacillum aliphaticivorans]